MKKMSLKKKFLIAFLIFLFILISGYLYVSLVFVPHKLKGILASEAEKFLHRKVTLDSIDVNLVKGITVKNLTIADLKDAAQPFVHMDELSFTVLFAPIFKSNIILIPSLTIVSPEITLTRESPTAWNFSDLIPAPSSTESPAASAKNSPSYQFALQKLTVTNGKIHFIDQSRPTPFKESLEDLRIDGSVSLSQKAQFDVSAMLMNHKSMLKLKGDFEIPTQKGQVAIDTENIYLNEYLPIFLDDKLNVLKSGLLNQVSLKINHTPTKTDISGSVELTQAKIILEPEQSVEGNFNLPQFSAAYEKGRISFQGKTQIHGLNVNVSPITIKQADIDLDIDEFTSNATATQLTYKGNLISPNLNLKSGPDMRLSGDVKLTSINLIQKDDDISLSGDFIFNKANIVISPAQSLEGNIHLANTAIALAGDKLKFNGDLSVTNTQLKVVQGQQTIQFSGDVDAAGLNVVKSGDILDAKSSLKVKQAVVDLGNSMIFKDTFSTTFSVKGNLAKTDEFLYDASLQLNDASISGLPTIQSIEHLKGTIDVGTNKAALHSLSFHTQNIPVTVEGTIANFLSPMGDLSINIPTINLENITPLLKQFVKDMPVSLTGSADLQANIKGSLTDVLSSEITANSSFSNIGVTGAQLPFPITNMSGALVATKDKATLKDVKLTLLEKEYVVNADIDNFKAPSLSAAIKGPDIDLTTQTQMIDETILVKTLEGKYFDSTFNVSGKIQTPKNQDPNVDFAGTANLTLADLKSLPQLADLMKQYNPEGNLAIDGSFKGSPQKMNTWDTLINVTSPQVKVMGYPIDSINVRYAQANNSTGNLDASALIYKGNFTTSASIDTTNSNLPIQMTAKLERLDLSGLRDILKDKAGNISGFVSSDITVSGPIKDVNALQGEGSIVVVEGYLGQLNFFNGLMGALLVVPQFKNMMITDASVNFVIQDGKISSDNILLSSPSIQLKGKGWIDFKNNLDIEVSPELSQLELAKSDSAKKFPTELITAAISVKCTGTANQPQCGLTNTPGKILEGTGDILKEGIKSVGGILEEIF